MPNVCAYCRKVDKLTREHVYPKFLYEKIGEKFLGYNEAADKVTLGERLVKDVCATCNNELLAKLDAYGQQYFQLNHLEHSFTNETAANVCYDYDCLLRWVLKVSYNSFRTVELANNPFASLIPYILTGKPRPKAKFVKLYIELIRGHKLTEEELPGQSEQFQRTGYIPCQIMLSGRIANQISEIDCHCRHFQVNAHRFTLFIFPYRTKASDSDRFVKLFKAQLPFTEYVNPNLAKLRLHVSERDVLDIQTGIHVHPRERSKEREFYLQSLHGKVS